MSNNIWKERELLKRVISEFIINYKIFLLIIYNGKHYLNVKIPFKLNVFIIKENLDLLIESVL